MGQDWARQQVVRFVAEHTGREPESIRLEEALVSLEIDSLEDVEFIMALEGETQKEIPYPTGPVSSVGDLVEYVRRAVEGG